jgi:hypothetical protein
VEITIHRIHTKVKIRKVVEVINRPDVVLAFLDITKIRIHSSVMAQDGLINEAESFAIIEKFMLIEESLFTHNCFGTQITRQIVTPFYWELVDE